MNSTSELPSGVFSDAPPVVIKTGIACDIVDGFVDGASWRSAVSAQRLFFGWKGAQASHCTVLSVFYIELVELERGGITDCNRICIVSHK